MSMKPIVILFAFFASFSGESVFAGSNLVEQLHARLREFGSWQKPGVTRYDVGRKGFEAPRDWIIEQP